MTVDSDIYMEKEEYPRHFSIFIEGEHLVNQTLKLMMKP